MKFWIYIFIFFIIGIFNSCGRNLSKKKDEVNVKTESDSIKNEAFVIYAKNKNNGVVYFKKSLITSKIEELVDLKETPFDLVINLNTDSILVIDEQGVYSKSFSRNGRLVKVGESLPFKSGQISFGQAWIDTKTSNLRATLSYSLYDTLDVNYPKFLKLLHDSLDYLPDWGSDQIAYVFELYNGKWRVLHEKATRGEACETPGLDVLISEIHPKTHTTSVNSEICLSSCAFRLKSSNSKIQSLELKEVNRLLKKKVSIESDGYFKLRLNSEVSLISEGCWTTATNPHFSNKIYLQNYKSGNYFFENSLYRRFKDDNYSTVAIQVTSKYILFSIDYSHEKPIIYDLTSMKSIESIQNVNSVFLLENY
jgi:hypothetical protein